MNTATQTPDLSQFTKEELQAHLANLDKQEKDEMKKRKKAFIDDKAAFLTHTSSKFKQLQKELEELKSYTIAKANELWQEMHEMNGRKPRENQKQFTLKNEEDTLKITVDQQERFEFTDEAVVHIQSIRDRFREKFQSRNKGLYNILESLLIKNSKQEYDPKLLAKARKEVRKLEDDELIEYFDKLDECQRVTDTALYCRVYVRDEQTKKYNDVSLNFSSL